MMRSIGIRRSSAALAAIAAAFALAAPGTGATQSSAQAGGQASDQVLSSSWRGQRQAVVPNLRRHAFAVARAVEVTGVRAHVRVVGNAARTTLEVDLSNPGHQQAEAELLLPVPSGAAVSGFFFEGSAPGATAELLPAAAARETYDAIVARLRDPALLEFAGQAAVRSSVFPVPALGTQRVRLIYDELLTDKAGRLDYSLPRTASLGSDVPWSLSLEVVSQAGVATVYSPTHALIETARGGTSATLEVDANAAAQPGPFHISILTGRDALSASILACPELDGKGGTFLLVAGLGENAADDKPIPRELTLVLDRSGSMAGAKFEQAREAARQVLEGLRAGERFRIVDYSDTVAAFSEAPVTKSAQTMESVRAYLDSLTTGGGTNIGGALTEALRPGTAKGSLGLVLFLTDGLPTVGETTEAGLRSIIAGSNRHERRIFPFGVGDNVNAPLLDAVATATRGSTTYVRPNEDVEVAVGGVFRRLKGPRLADLELEFFDEEGQVDTQITREVLPARLPDLFEGDQLVLLGRYTEARPLTVRIRGRAGSGMQSYRVRADLGRANPRNDFVPRLWATRRIAVLMDGIRQATGDGVSATVAAADPRTKELADEILELSTKYGVLSEFTAFLALEGTALGSWNDLAMQTRDNVVLQNSSNRWGASAVNIGRNYNEGVLAQQTNAQQAYWNSVGERVNVDNNQQVIGGFALQRGSSWIEGELLKGNESGELPEPDVEIELGTEAHRRLVDELVVDRRNGLAALQGDVLLRHRGQIVRLRNDAANRAEDDPRGSQETEPEGIRQEPLQNGGW